MDQEEELSVNQKQSQETSYEGNHYKHNKRSIGKDMKILKEKKRTQTKNIAMEMKTLQKERNDDLMKMIMLKGTIKSRYKMTIKLAADGKSISMKCLTKIQTKSKRYKTEEL